MARKLDTYDRTHDYAPRRSIRISDDEWAALGMLAKRKGLSRSALVRLWIHEQAPEFFGADEPLQGQASLGLDGEPS